MSWFRFYTDTIQDRKIRRLSLAHRWLWVAVLSLAKESPIQGHLLLSRNVSVTFHDISDAANLPIEEVQSGIQLFVEYDMMHQDEEDGHYIVTHWGKRQFVSDDTTSRVQKHRERQRENTKETLPVTESKRFKDVSSNDIVTPHITETETEIKDNDHSSKSDGCNNEFETFWSIYPRKIAKQKAFGCWKARRKEHVPVEILMQAVHGYVSHCKKKGTEQDYMLHPSTFLNKERRYEDYLNPQEDEDEPSPPKQYYRASAEESEEVGSVFDLLTGQSG